MSYVSPEMYRNVLKKTVDLIDEVEAYLANKTPDGLILPIRFKCEIEKLIIDCEHKKAILPVYINGLKPNSLKKQKYQDALSEIVVAEEKLINLKQLYFE